MPSHIFSRVGLWPEMVESNRASYLAAKSELQETTLGVGTYDALHAMDYMVFAHLQQAQDRAAKESLDEVAAIRKVNVENSIAAYAFASIPARFALERGDWKQAAALKLSPADLSWNRFPQAEAILIFARGLGASRAGDVASARRDADRLQVLKEAMTAGKMDYWAGQADFQIKTIGAWVALAENRQEEAVRLMRAAADAEDASDKHPVTPGNVAPSRELLGEMLIALSSPAEAFTEFERSLRRDPNRFRGVYGAARAAEASGNRRAALDYYARLLKLAVNRDTERPELAQARAFLENSTSQPTPASSPKGPRPLKSVKSLECNSHNLTDSAPLVGDFRTAVRNMPAFAPAPELLSYWSSLRKPIWSGLPLLVQAVIGELRRQND